MDLKSLIAFRATGVKNGHSGNYNYRSPSFDPGMIIFMRAKSDAFI